MAPHRPDPIDRQPGPSRGMALIDLLLVVAILGIVTAVAVRTQDDEDLPLQAAARGVAADLLQAQALAIETRSAVGLWFDRDTNATWFVVRNGKRPAEVRDALRTSGDFSEAEVQRLCAAQSRGDAGLGPVSIASADFGGLAQATFLADGSARDGGFVELRLGSAWLRVRVQAATGRVTVTAP
ncbi:MAG: hypothetical protein U1F60_03860 [Planctomycetota bacterium]